MTLISPSLLSANFMNLSQDINLLEKAGADMLHIDVMDGHFVPNLTMGPFIIQALKKFTSIPLDVHLMINNAESFIDQYIDAGADFLTVHAEGVTHLERTINHIRSRGKKAGIALNPSTHENSLEYVLDNLDLVLLMTVNPGFAKQNFLSTVVKKISAVKKMLAGAKNQSCILSVDGGITPDTADICKKAGATCLVSGSYIFQSLDINKAITKLR